MSPPFLSDPPLTSSSRACRCRSPILRSSTRVRSSASSLAGAHTPLRVQTPGERRIPFPGREVPAVPKFSAPKEPRLREAATVTAAALCIGVPESCEDALSDLLFDVRAAVAVVVVAAAAPAEGFRLDRLLFPDAIFSTSSPSGFASVSASFFPLPGRNGATGDGGGKGGKAGRFPSRLVCRERLPPTPSLSLELVSLSTAASSTAVRNSARVLLPPGTRCRRRLPWSGRCSPGARTDNSGPSPARTPVPSPSAPSTALDTVVPCFLSSPRLGPKSSSFASSPSISFLLPLLVWATGRRCRARTSLFLLASLRLFLSAARAALVRVFSRCAVLGDALPPNPDLVLLAAFRRTRLSRRLSARDGRMSYTSLQICVCVCVRVCACACMCAFATCACVLSDVTGSMRVPRRDKY